MTRFADPLRCPDCRAPLPAGSQLCTQCGLDLGGELGRRLFATLTTADDLLRQMREHSARAAAALVGAPVAAGTPSAPVGEAPAGLPPAAGGPVTGPPAAAPATVRPSSVPKILLTLGATCLLVAALVFLAVTWSVMGIGGRTATLVGFTAVGGGLTALTARRGLRGAVEALGAVTGGLAVLDLVGARSAGWLGEPSDATFAVVLGVIAIGSGLAATTALARTAARGFTVGELAMVAGSLLVLAGLDSGAWATADVRALVATLLLAAVAAATWTRVDVERRTFVVAAAGTTAVAAAAWAAESLHALDRATQQPSVTALWGHLEVWPLLASAAVGVGLSFVPQVPRAARVVALGVSVVLAAVAVTLPSYDESTTTLSLTVAAAVVLLALAVELAPRPWAAAGLGALAMGSVTLLVPAFEVLSGALRVYADTASRHWTGTAGDPVANEIAGTDVASWLLPVCVAAVLCAALAAFRLTDEGRAYPLPRILAAAGALIVVSSAAAALLHPVPVWAFLAVLLVAATAAMVPVLVPGRVRAVTGQVLCGVALVLVAAALPLSFTAASLTAATLLVALVLVGLAHLRTGDRVVAEVSGGLLPFVLAGLVWSGGAAFGVEGPWRTVVGLLVLGALLLGRGTLGRDASSPAVAVLEACTGLAAMPLATAGVAAAALDLQATWAAVYLTISGGCATVLALVRPDRRQVAWLGGLLLAAASWVRLWDVGVHEPEPYTLPSALVLLAVGLVHLRRNPRASTQTALGAGLALALVPSLLWVLADPTGLRALLLGLACLVLVVAGVQTRWSAPLVYGAVVGLLVVLREAGPAIGDSVPRWALIGGAGVLLIGLGVTWEARLRDARRAVAYLRALR